MAPPPLRVLVVDDSALYRKIVRTVLEQIPGVEVIGTAINGRFALDRIIADRPDAITLDLEMPELDGLGLLRELKTRKIALTAIVISSLSTAGAQATSEALQLGAFDFVLKPSAGGPDANANQLRIDLAPRIDACLAMRSKKSAPRVGAAATSRVIENRTASPRGASPTTSWKTPRIIGIGVSTGGPVALQKLLPQFPADFPCPIVVVQHMPPIFTKTLANDLNRNCPLEVVEGGDGMTVQPGRVILAPGGKQMRVAKDHQQTFMQVTDDPPERNCRPAVDFLFRSLAVEFGDRAWGVILTGMGDDGTLGCMAMKQRGSAILAQDEASCVVYGMPRAVAEAGVVDFVAPLDGIADRLKDALLQGAPA
ncbi:MAG: chemotaxis response regulator protein-glutamate methylesterase [Pirellulales bacterium]|nr:chemotaxis response regulator protein-glutamate methylesterase [Pirellulales bacterium]